ncbi:FAD-dependent oxidoreductase [Halomonas halmophila]|uniref:Pyridine nucleotide-disulfide oxidoreductase n=1 Tax=Halomonas halmophila TaxID=252 RepID=A0A4Y4F2F9_9GAMM|nr:FAD-dependent oxidoreductase [Halomonas halmophila]GED22835.1 pyridine nucleotide-disulfide oxidoreductase [Halomonas halmophila]
MIHLLLIGGGHAHAFVLEAFARQPEPGVSITLVMPGDRAPYSGMVPAWLAGEYTTDDMTLGMAWLAKRAGARLVQDSVVAIRAAEQRVQLASGDWLEYDQASLNVGATLAAPAREPSAQAPELLPMRPLDALQERWPALLAEVAAWPTKPPRRVLAVGAGAAGCETLLAVLARLRAERPDIDWQGTLLGHSAQPLPGSGRLPAWLMRRQLARAGVAWHGEHGASQIVDQGVEDERGQVHPADLVLWATGACGHDWLANSDLPLDDRGFIAVTDTLAVRQPRAGPPSLWAAGDCAAFAPPLPKAGVHAVRMGPLLAENLRHACRSEPTRPYQPQRQVLALIGTGDGRAIASRGALGIAGRWVWRWKQRIDRRFIARFTPPPED